MSRSTSSRFHWDREDRPDLFPPRELLRIYPETDGVETGEHSGTMDHLMDWHARFHALFRDRRHEVAVKCRMFWYPREGHPLIRHAPHFMFAFGRPNFPRQCYLQWLEDDIAPQVVLEIEPRLETEGRAAELFDFYDRYGVEEYYRLDWLSGKLEGWTRSEDGRLRPIADLTAWTSPRLGVRFRLEGRRIVLSCGGDESPQEMLNIIRERDRLRTEIETIQVEIRQDRERGERLTAMLRELGVDPDGVPDRST